MVSSSSTSKGSKELVKKEATLSFLFKSHPAKLIYSVSSSSSYNLVVAKRISLVLSVLIDDEATEIGRNQKQSSLSPIIMMTSRTSTPVKDRRDDAGSFIKQGFLCPECKSQFANIDELEDHFNSIHLNEKSPKEAGPNPLGNHLNNLNKFFGKAKKILKTDPRNEDASSANEFDRSASEEMTTLAKPKHNESDCYFALRKGQTIGHSRDHFDEQFKKIRNSKIERDVQETNKLLIRIDQLLQDLPAGKLNFI